VKIIPESLYTSLVCSLPPTCSGHKATQLSSAQDAEDHYAKFHTFVCEDNRCRRIFPDAKFLELHFAECHDPIVALKKERGEKTFACYQSSCPGLFGTPKGRRLHLIQAHGYPKQYFFAVTNKGIGGLLRKWGPGASLYRGDWKPRPKDQHMKSDSDSGEIHGRDHGGDMDVEIERDEEGRPPHMNSKVIPAHEPTCSSRPAPPPPPQSHDDTNELSNAMSSLSLVPDKIRFGRGGKKGGFSHYSQDVKIPRKIHKNPNKERPNGNNESNLHESSITSCGRGGKKTQTSQNQPWDKQHEW